MIGQDVAGIVDEVGGGVVEVAVGGRVFGSTSGAAQAEFALLVAVG